MTILEEVGELVVVRCWCGLQHGVPKSLHDQQKRKHDRGEKMPIYCPLGHSWVPGGESRASKLERQLQQERQRGDQAQAEARQQREAAEKAQKQIKRIKTRAAGGVCSCCNRYFPKLHEHMSTQHPEVARDAGVSLAKPRRRAAK